MPLLKLKTSLVNTSANSAIGSEIKVLLNSLGLRSTSIENIAATTNTLTDLQRVS